MSFNPGMNKREVSEAYALRNYRMADIHHVAFDKKYGDWYFDGDFKGCSPALCLGRGRTVSMWYRPAGVVYVEDPEVRCIFVVHILE